MEDWGRGMLQSRREMRVLGDYEEVFGLRELRAKINAKAGLKLGTKEHRMQAIRLSVCVDQCYGSRAVEITRKYLDFGPLVKEFQTAFIDDEKYKVGNGAQKFVILTAGAMTLGCAIPASAIDVLTKIIKSKDLKAFWTPEARAQMIKAMSSYVDGTPYDFGNKTLYECMIGDRIPGSKTTLENIGNQKVVKTIGPSGTVLPQIIGPPSDEEIGLKPIYEYDVCATCAADPFKDDNMKLMVCGKCKERKCCSQACQKQHWKLHKPICSRPKEEMEAFMISIPLDWTDEANPDFGTLFGD